MFERLLSGLILTLLLSLGAHADAPVWKVSRGGSYFFVGGTIHVLQAQDYPLPDEFEQAYEIAEKLVFEVNIGQANSTLFQQSLLQAALYTDGSNLASHLRPATLARLRSFMDTRGIPLESMLPFRVGMLVTLLTVNEMQRQGIQGTGVDEYYFLRAENDNKPVTALESIAQQISFLSKLGEGEEDEIVLQTLEELEDFVAEFDLLKSAWRQGDVRRLEKIGLEDFQAFPRAYQSMLVARNTAWIPRLEAMLADQVVEYILVGVLHLVGPDSVLKMLEQKGYQVQRFQ